MFHVEFMGVPGAGKSTLKGRALKVLKQKGHKVYGVEDLLLSAMKRRRDDKFCPVILGILPKNMAKKYIYGIFRTSWSQFYAQGRFAIEQRESLLAFLSSDKYKKVKSISSDEKALAISSALEAASKYQIMGEETDHNDIVVFDIGFIHTSMSLFISPRVSSEKIDQESMMDYLESIPIPDLVIWVETDVMECQRRILCRSSGRPLRLIGIDEDQMLFFLSTCHQQFEKISSWLKNKRKIVVRIKNDIPLEQAVDQLSEKIIDVLPMLK